MAKGDNVKVVHDQFIGLLVTQGVVAIAFGIVALFWPGLTASLFVSMFGIFILILGVVGFIFSLLSVGRVNLWWLQMLFNLLIIGLGVYLLRNPQVTAQAIILLTGFTLVAHGIVDAISGLFSKDHDVVNNRWMFIIGGILGIVSGVIIISYPVATGLMFVWALGLYMLLRGGLDIGLAFRLRAED